MGHYNTLKKTILSQIKFQNIEPDTPILYFTLLTFIADFKSFIIMLINKIWTKKFLPQLAMKLDISIKQLKSLNK
jgi:hypothetical protein